MLNKVDNYSDEFSLKDYLCMVDRCVKRLKLYEPLDKKEVESYNNFKRIKEVYASNSLEGNTFTISETTFLLNTGNVPGNKSLKECNEIKDLNNALLIVENYLLNDIDLDIDLIKKIHLYTTRSTLDLEDSGSFRIIQNWIGGANINTSPPHVIDKHMLELMEWYSNNKDTMHKVELAVIFSYRFVCIHPFLDGNGRTSRIIMNYVLRLNGFISVSIDPSKNKKEYYDALQEDGEDKNKFGCKNLTKLVCVILEEEYNSLIETLEA